MLVNIVKIVAIMWVAVITFYMGYAAARIIDSSPLVMAGPTGLMRLALLVAVLALVTHASSDLVGRIPFPLDGAGGFSIKADATATHANMASVGIAAVVSSELLEKLAYESAGHVGDGAGGAGGAVGAGGAKHGDERASIPSVRTSEV